MDHLAQHESSGGRAGDNSSGRHADLRHESGGRRLGEPPGGNEAINCGIADDGSVNVGLRSLAVRLTRDELARDSRSLGDLECISSGRTVHIQTRIASKERVIIRFPPPVNSASGDIIPARHQVGGLLAAVIARMAISMQLILPLTFGWSPSPHLHRPTSSLGPPRLLACASSSSREPAEAQAAFKRWMEATCPPGAVPRNYSTAPGVGVQTMEGALAATWHAVCLSLCQPGDVPSLSVVLLPLVKAVATQAGMLALQRHLRSCRDCCAGFGKRLELQTLHPSSDAPGRTSPVPALTLSRLGSGC